jgi:tRNA(Arg) A34 adenosine deaminase TadA
MSYLRMASRLLAKHPDDAKFRLVCIAFKGRRVASYGFNSLKTHTAAFRVILQDRIVSRYNSEPCPCLNHSIHAEWAAVKKAKCEVDRVVVYRESRLGQPSMARPCNICMGLLRRSGVKEIIYSNHLGHMEIEKI